MDTGMIQQYYGTTQCGTSDGLLDEEHKKMASKVELLEKKIRAKD